MVIFTMITINFNNVFFSFIQKSPTVERVSWYMTNDLTHSLERSRNSHSPALSYPRSASVHSELSSHMTQPIYQHPHHHMSTNTLPFSPPDHSSYSSNSSKSFQRSRESSFRRTGERERDRETETEKDRQTEGDRE